MTNKTGPTADQQAAHWLLSELRTRIATQTLPYQHGVEERALENLFEVFALARDAMKQHPGCEVFARETTQMLNVVLRPVTGKWQRAKEQGRLQSRDGGDAFRADLADVQVKLRAFTAQLGAMAYGAETVDSIVPPPLSAAELAACLAPIPFGIPSDPAANGGIESEMARQMNAKEAECIHGHRTVTGRQDAGTDAVGLALSGGGIRSATFCLGVTQVLAAKKLLPGIDFLSTVSGGGYTGCFLTTRLGRGASPEELGWPHGPDSPPIRELRRRAKFLVGRGLWESWGMVLETLLGMLVNWCVPLFVLVLGAMAAILVQRAGLDPIWWYRAAAVLTAFVAMVALIFFRRERTNSRTAAAAGKTLVVGASLLCLCLLFWFLDRGFHLLIPLTGGRWELRELQQALARIPVVGHAGTGANWLTIGCLVSLLPQALRFVPMLENPRVRKVVLLAALLVGALIVPVLAVIVSYALFAFGGIVNEGHSVGLYYLAATSAVLAIVITTVLNINTTGPHRLFRRGLGRTFVDRPNRISRPVFLQRINRHDRAPYHLVNCTVNLPGSEDLKLRERRCDFFLFSKHWTGSPVLGYAPTSQWRMNGQKADLATAMAISGAAFSTSMGLGSIRPLRALLTFLNVRLGYWIHRPPTPDAPAARLSWNERARRYVRNTPWRCWQKLTGRHPGFSCLLHEMTGLFMSEKRRWLNLSDGGHIENLGIYELLRRRCKFIVCVDGEADPDYTFHGLMTLVRHAQLDLGVEIGPDLRDLRPDPETGHSRSHYQLCRVYYPAREPGGERPIGLLLYVKLSVTGNESELIRRYRGNHPAFPHETTLDQFFGEEQFEAYRQLGVHCAEGLFARSLMDGNVDPASVPAWFAQLARNLLESKD
ncbi:MAG TPA: hypothetical protein VFT55_09780 [Planctomycetota bacterium]|nr:hypothetical protein [Planctomycetota bacterium]